MTPLDNDRLITQPPLAIAFASSSASSVFFCCCFGRSSPSFPFPSLPFPSFPFFQIFRWPFRCFSFIVSMALGNFFHFCAPFLLLTFLCLLQLFDHCHSPASSSPSPSSSSSLLLSSSSSQNCSNFSDSSPSTFLFSEPIFNRPKRQWNNYSPMQFHCPPGCFSCTPIHCQAYQCIQPQMMPMVRCCCRPMFISRSQPDLKTACDGEEAVAACLNGLCGQGYFCQRGKFCCRCPVGKSIGRCVNGLCPIGYVCNSNDFCCAVGITTGGAIGPCVNGECPEGFACGEGDLCYPNSVGTSLVEEPKAPTRNFPLNVRAKRPYWATKTRRRGAQKGRKNGGTKRRWWGRRENPWEVRRTRGGWTDGAWEESGEGWAAESNELR